VPPRICQGIRRDLPAASRRKHYPVSNAYADQRPHDFLIDTGGAVTVSSMGFDKKDLETIATHSCRAQKNISGAAFPS